MTSERACGTCSLCCKLIGVDAIGKPAGRWCGHARPRRGCAIYADRPAPCRAFTCLWLDEPALPDRLRPDRTHVVLTSDGRSITAHVEAATPQAHRSGEVAIFLDAAKLRGVPVLAVVGERRYGLTSAGEWAPVADGVFVDPPLFPELEAQGPVARVAEAARAAGYAEALVQRFLALAEHLPAADLIAHHVPKAALPSPGGGRGRASPGDAHEGGRVGDSPLAGGPQ